MSGYEIPPPRPIAVRTIELSGPSGGRTTVAVDPLVECASAEHVSNGYHLYHYTDPNGQMVRLVRMCAKEADRIEESRIAKANRRRQKGDDY